LSGTAERFYLKVLINPLKEQLDLPTLVIDIGGGLGRKLENLGDEGPIVMVLRKRQSLIERPLTGNLPMSFHWLFWVESCRLITNNKPKI
jgi:hypothetical protein